MKRFEITVYQDSKKKYEKDIVLDNNTLLQLALVSFTTKTIIQTIIKFGIAGYLVFDGVEGVIHWKYMQDLMSGL